MAAFHVPPFVFFVRCGGEAVFFVCSEDYPEVIYQNVNLLIPTLCGSIIRVFVRGRWKIRDSRAVSRTSAFPAQSGKWSGSFSAIRVYKMTARFGMPFRSD